MSSEDDRRRAERVPVNFEFAGLPRITYISDLSATGVFVHTDRRPPIGSEVSLRFTVVLDDPVILQGRGRVVRHSNDPSGVGIEFVEANPELVLRLSDVVTRQRPHTLGTPHGDDEPTQHRAAIPREFREDFEVQPTGRYPSVRIQVQDPDEGAEAGADPGEPTDAGDLLDSKTSPGSGRSHADDDR